MIAILGASGYIGKIFLAHFNARGIACIPVSRFEVNYYDSVSLADFIEKYKVDFLVNAAGFTGKPNVDACEIHKGDCLMANAVLPGRIKVACEMSGISWGHVSSGCIYNGPSLDDLGFTEMDVPNFSFRIGNGSFYSGSKALGEEMLLGTKCYIWRLRMPFHEIFDERNYIGKILTYEKLLEAENSLSHLGDYVDACCKSIEIRPPFGIYNLTNPGSIKTSELVDMAKKFLNIERDFKFFRDEEEFLSIAAKAPRSNCILNTDKQRVAGIEMRPLRNALETSLMNWTIPSKT